MTCSPEKFCLKWKDFQQNIVSSYHDLRKNKDFCDVTLVCEDEKLEAQKIILTACSPFFSTVLKRNTHSHPMIYMRGLKSKDLVAIVDFIYLGEENIYQEDLGSFLALADELQLKGLVGAQADAVDNVQEKNGIPKQETKEQRNPNVRQEEYPYQSLKSEGSDTNTFDSSEDHLMMPIDASKLLFYLDPNKEDLKTQLESMIVEAEGGEIKYICNPCGKTTTGKNWGSAKQHMRSHVETHLAGLSYPCKQCGKVSGTSNGLNHHIKKYHCK